MESMLDSPIQQPRPAESHRWAVMFSVCSIAWYASFPTSHLCPVESSCREHECSQDSEQEKRTEEQCVVVRNQDDI
jgi:hypothetical protein